MMRKVVCLGKAGKEQLSNVFCSVEIKDGELTISGVVGPMRSGDCAGSAGQIVDEPIKEYNVSDGWNLLTVAEFYKVWHRWHLNKLRPGTAEQEKAIEIWKKAGNQYTYDGACEYLKSIGLYEVNGYKYGHGWITEELPQRIVDYVEGLKETRLDPAWV
jgi:hypothetical protein